AGGGNTGGGTGGKTGGSTGFASVVSEQLYNQMFPSRNALYTYSALVAAAGSFAGFVSSRNATVDKQEAAAFLANVGHETGNLVFTEEIAKATLCSPSAACGCAPGQQYFGRGPLQLSFNFNYCTTGAALGVDLLNHPGLVSSDSTISWKTAVL